MDLLYSNILPLPTTEEQETISDCFINQLKSSERIDICVGYVSDNSLKELEQLIDDNNISNVTLTIGMYFIEGMPEKAYHTAMRINEKWQSADPLTPLKLIIKPLMGVDCEDIVVIEKIEGVKLLVKEK